MTSNSQQIYLQKCHTCIFLYFLLQIRTFFWHLLLIRLMLVVVVPAYLIYISDQLVLYYCNSPYSCCITLLSAIAHARVSAEEKDFSLIHQCIPTETRLSSLYNINLTIDHSILPTCKVKNLTSVIGQINLVHQGVIKAAECTPLSFHILPELKNA